MFRHQGNPPRSRLGREWYASVGVIPAHCLQKEAPDESSQQWQLLLRLPLGAAARRSLAQAAGQQVGGKLLQHLADYLQGLRETFSPDQSSRRRFLRSQDMLRYSV